MDEFRTPIWGLHPCKDGGFPWVYVRASDGNWYYPDCSYSCNECGACLGCVRKMMIWEKEDESYSLNDCEAICRATGGDHVFNIPEGYDPEELTQTPSRTLPPQPAAPPPPSQFWYWGLPHKLPGEETGPAGLS